MKHQLQTVLALILVLLALPAVAADGFLALVGGRLIDGTGAAPMEDAVVVIEQERILYAGPRSAVEIPTGAELIDMEGLTVLPGFVNAHVHHGFDGPNRERWAFEGVTTVRDLGCAPANLPLARQIYPRAPERARLVAAGPLITVPGGYPIVPFGAGWSAAVTSVNEARELGEDLLDHGGADLLKLALETGTVFGRQIPVLSRSQASMLVRVAHGRGTVASAHITSTVDIDLALDVGADDLAHMAVDRIVSDGDIERIIAEDVTWVPTLELYDCSGAINLARANLRRFVQAGGRVALGTDYEGYDCDWELGMPMTEVELMSSAGMTPMQIIVAATANGARVCGLEREIGTLQTGKTADILVVEGDPLSDLHALEEVRLVLHYGTVIRNELPRSGSNPRAGARRVH